MNRDNLNNDLLSQARTEACDWLSQLNAPDCTPNTELEFQRWLRSEELHSLAYEQAQLSWQMSEFLRHDEDLSALLDEARGEGVEAMPASSTKSSAASKPAANDSQWWGLSALAASVMVGLATLLFWPSESERIETAVGEQRLVQLEDGSSISLNTDTQVRIDYSDQCRCIELIEGEAYFSVAKNAQVPFRVHAGVSQVTAVGTEFNVNYHDHNAFRVEVTEGVVELAAQLDGADHARSLTELNLGQAVAYQAPKLKPSVQSFNQARIEAWRSEKILFNNQPLSQAIEEYNRYSLKPLVLTDQSLAEQTISGRFAIGDLGAFTQALEHSFDIALTDTGESILISSAQSL